MTSICNNIHNPYISHIHFLQPFSIDTWSNPFYQLSRYCNVTMSKFTEKVRFYRGWTPNPRLSAKSAFEFANRYLVGYVVILANLDIEFDETLGLLQQDRKLSYSNAYFLSRYESEESKSLITTQCSPEYMGSHDSFIFVPPLPRPLISRCNFQLGQVGMEARLIWEFEMSGLTVSNPCLSVKTWHHHSSNIRNWIDIVANEGGKSSIAHPKYL